MKRPPYNQECYLKAWESRGLVLRVIRQHYPRHTDPDWLATMGLQALHDAYRLYDPEKARGLPFAGYACGAILRAVSRAAKFPPLVLLDELPDAPARDAIGPAEEAADRSHRVSLLLKTLRADSREILCDYYGLFGRDELTSAEIARRRGLSHAHVRNKIAKAIARIRTTQGVA